MQSLGRLRFSAVYRPVGSRFILLDSTEFRRELLDGDVFGSRSNRLVNNANLNVKLDRKTQISFQYGAKYLLEDIDGQNLHGYTDVAGVELRRDLWGGFDAGVRAGLRHSYADGTVPAALQRVGRLHRDEEPVGHRGLQLRRLPGQ